MEPLRAEAPVPALPPAAALRAAWTGLARMIAQAVTCWFHSGVSDLASSIAFQSQLSLAPFLVLLMSGASRLLGSAGARTALLDVVRSYAGESAVPSAGSVIDTVVHAPGGTLATVVSLATLAWFSSGMMLAVRSAMNRIWGTRSTLRGALRERVISLILVPGALLAILATMFLGLAGGVATTLMGRWIPGAAPLGSALVGLLSLALLGLQLAFVFRFGAAVRLRGSDVWPGAALTAALYTAGNALIGRLVARSLLVPLYGPAGALIAVLLWIYYGAQILLLGACFTRAWSERYGSRATALTVH